MRFLNEDEKHVIYNENCQNNYLFHQSIDEYHLYHNTNEFLFYTLDTHTSSNIVCLQLMHDNLTYIT